MNQFLKFLELPQEFYSFSFAAFLNDEFIALVNKTAEKWKTASMIPNFIGSSR